MIRRSLMALACSLFISASYSAESVATKIDLLEVIKSGDVEYNVNPAMDFHDPPGEIWKFAGDELQISGRGYGYVATKKSYRDYHLVIEFKWGTKTWGKRESAARDNGILLHAYGPHGAYGGTWMASIEAQIIEGGVGDILVLSPKLADGTELTTSLMSEFALDRDKEKVWRKGEPRQLVTKGRINWRGRDVDWADKKGYRGPDDVESPSGEWNRLEVIARGDTLQYFVNGALVNEAFDCKPSEGRVLLQTEGAEMIVRRYELWPLGEFKEKWNPIQASGGSDVSVREGQETAMSPADSQKLVQLDGPYEVQLVACEPLVVDPVEVAWDAQGRMFVADMRDYPLGPPSTGDPWLSRIQMLTDEDGDGRMDKAVTFADHVDNVQGLLPYKDGLIATTRSEVLYLKDTDGDGKADLIEPLIKGLNPKHAQLQVSAPRWGLDNWVYFNNGLSAQEIYPASDAKVPAIHVGRCNFRWNPATGGIEATTGYGQYGGAFDDFGHHFFCSNRNPLMFAVMPYEAVTRNPHAGITQGWEDIAPAGAETRVYPVRITHTTADAHAGTNTAACGLGVYRGDLMPELKNNVFVCDPTGQLVTRYKVEPSGASLKATRVGAHTEFFRSGDEWSRPVNVTTGPDGALYICDMYRRYIDHARFFPEEFVKSHDMRQGESEGRIWRVVPKGSKVRRIAPAPRSAEKLTAWLGHENAWQRETARRLLAEMGQPIAGAQEVPGQPEGRKLFFEILAHADPADGSSDGGLIAQRVKAIADYPDDPWMAKAVLSSSLRSCGAVLAGLMKSSLAEQYTPQRFETLRSLAGACAATGDASDFAVALGVFQQGASELKWWQPPVLQGLAEGLPRSAGKLGAKTLADLVAKPATEHLDAAKAIGGLMARIEATAKDPEADLATRLAVLPLLAQRKWDQVQPIVKELLSASQGAELEQAAVALLKRFPATTTSGLIYELLPKAGPSLKRDLVPILTANGTTALAFFKRMEKGEFPTAWVDIETRWRYQRGSGEMHDLAVKLFGQPSSDRAALITSYMDCTKKLGDAKKGQQVFSTICIACHKIGDLGQEVGPPLSDVKAKPPEALLSDILDPNRMFEARWTAYQIEMRDGRILSGLITGETTDSIVLTMMGGAKETIQRRAIKEMKSLDRSLMPVGLEATIDKEQMSDLLAFLLGR